ncbi:MAG: hypothetical protein GY874_21195 [Desulfobacteraceae bacterium]|nr:hypothetical protein [Desulfobacteraceae bacterium]
MFAYFPVWNSLLKTWANSEQYSHGFLIIPIVVFLLFQKKKELKKIARCHHAGGFLLL